MKRVLASLPFASALVVLYACSSNPPAVSAKVSLDGGTGGPPPPPPPGYYDAGPTGSPPPPPPPPADAGAPVMPTFFTDAGSPSNPPPALTDQALDVVIDGLVAGAAPKVAPKMAEEGQPGRATLKEGDHFPMMINLQPNRCYTIIGASPPGMVSQFEIKLLGPPLYNIEAGKSAPTDKALPVVGKGAAALCPISPIVIPYKVDAVATKGAGRIGIHVYSRSK